MTGDQTPSGRLYAFSGLCAILGLLYGVLGVEPATPMLMLLRIGPAVAVASWLTSDAKRHHVVEVHDAGLLFYATWIFILPWYATRTVAQDKWRFVGRLYALGLAGVIGQVCGALVHFVLAGGARPAA